MMEEFEYHNLCKKLNEEQRLIFDDIMHKKQLYLDTPICLFLIGDVGTGKTFTLKLIIQGLLRLYNKDMSFDLTKTKVLFMALISKVAFNINDLTIHSTLNILVQQSLFNLPSLSLNLLNMLTCRCEQLQLVMINEILIVGVRMFNVINNRLRSIKHIQNNFFGGVDVIMISDFFQAPLMKDSWIF
jgi:archaellum biogenesis ATPase FlaH